MAQLWRVRLPDGRVLQPGDWTSAEPLYSTVEVNAGAITTLTAFSYGLGGDVPGSPGPRRSDLRDTNLEGEGARIPENEELIIYNISVETFAIGTAGDVDAIPAPDVPHVSLMNMLRLQRDLIVVTRIANVKDYTLSPLSYWPASTGVEQVNSGATSDASNGTTGWLAGNNGGPSVCDQRVLASPLYVAGGESLAIDFETPGGQVSCLDLGDANSRVRLRTFLDGYRRRPVA